jgi:manganese oxidase
MFSQSRRAFFSQAGVAMAASAVSSVAMAALPELNTQTSPNTQEPYFPEGVTGAGRPYQPVVTLNGWTLPWRMKNGVKEFHLVAEPVQREIASGMVAQLWGYNGQSPGPTIEVVEGDRVRIFVTNRLPEATTIHWHGQRVPNGMDGVAGLTQPAIPSGKTWVYEFIARRPGTFMYHPHSDDMTQMAMGMMGMWITHPRGEHPLISKVDRDFCFLLNAYDISPGSSRPKPATMLDFNVWTWNSRAFPGIDPLVCRLNDRVRIRVGNLTMTNHPIHLHGHEFEVTGTDGGAIPKTARWPEVTTDIGVGQMRQLELIASEEGDWALHCHKSHHTMNAMGHGVPNLIGVEQADVEEKIRQLIPDYMAMGSAGMGEMAGMTMPLPENTLPMMTGEGPHGSIEMGGMFSLLKVRRNQKAGDYRDPGWFTPPAGTQAYEWTGPLEPAPQMASPSDKSGLKVNKPDAHHDHHHH